MSGFDINQFRTSEELENKGVWRDLGKEARVLIARLGNAEFRKMFSEMVQPYTETGVAVPEDVQEDITVRCLARTVLLGWEKILDGDEELEYSYDNAVRALTEMRDFRELVIKLASKQDAYKEKQDKVIEGNSESASGGLSNGETS